MGDQQFGKWLVYLFINVIIFLKVIIKLFKSMYKRFHLIVMTLTKLHSTINYEHLFPSVQGVYAFGFLFMLPQLFVNYKVGSLFVQSLFYSIETW